MPNGLRYLDIAGGTDHSIALRSDGKILTWGGDALGQVSMLRAAPPGYTYIDVKAASHQYFARMVSDCLVEPLVDCESKVNSLGCAPQIALSSTSSASAGSGYTLSASQMLAQMPGLCFHSTIGPDFLPFRQLDWIPHEPSPYFLRPSASRNSPCAG